MRKQIKTRSGVREVEITVRTLESTVVVSGVERTSLHGLPIKFSPTPVLSSRAWFAKRVREVRERVVNRRSGASRRNQLLAHPRR